MTLPPTRNDSYQKLYWYNLFLLMMSVTCSKHVENYKWINTLKGICASSWTITKYLEYRLPSENKSSQNKWNNNKARSTNKHEQHCTWWFSSYSDLWPENRGSIRDRRADLGHCIRTASTVHTACCQVDLKELKLTTLAYLVLKRTKEWSCISTALRRWITKTVLNEWSKE